jgi:hypothetical protein
MTPFASALKKMSMNLGRATALKDLYSIAREKHRYAPIGNLETFVRITKHSEYKRYLF